MSGGGDILKFALPVAAVAAPFALGPVLGATAAASGATGAGLGLGAMGGAAAPAGLFGGTMGMSGLGAAALPAAAAPAGLFSSAAVPWGLGGLSMAGPVSELAGPGAFAVSNKSGGMLAGLLDRFAPSPEDMLQQGMKQFGAQDEQQPQMPPMAPPMPDMAGGATQAANAVNLASPMGSGIDLMPSTGLMAGVSPRGGESPYMDPMFEDYLRYAQYPMDYEGYGIMGQPNLATTMRAF